MPVPPFQDLFLPFLKYSADGQIRSTQDIGSDLAKHFNLSPIELAELLPSSLSDYPSPDGIMRAFHRTSR
jgi:restriction endonuclease Mrr